MELILLQFMMETDSPTLIMIAQRLLIKVSHWIQL